MLVQKLLEARNVMLALNLTVLQVPVTVTAHLQDNTAMKVTRLPYQLRAYRITEYHQKKS